MNAYNIDGWFNIKKNAYNIREKLDLYDIVIIFYFSGCVVVADGKWLLVVADSTCDCY